MKGVELGTAGAAAPEVAVLGLVASNVGNFAAALVTVAAGTPKAGVLWGAFGTTVLPPNDGPENTKPPVGWSGLEIVVVKLGAEEVVVGTDDEAGRAGKAVDAAAGNWNGVDKVEMVVLVKPARSGFTVVEGVVVGSRVLGVAVDVALWLAGVIRPKKPAPNWGFVDAGGVLVVDAADETGVLAPAAGVAAAIPSTGLGEAGAMVEDTLMTGLLMTDTVLVVEPCNGAALVVTLGGVGRKGRLPAGATDIEASAVVTGVSPFASSLVSCRLPKSLLSLCLSRA